MSKSLKIGNIELDNPFLLAPLAGITDAPTAESAARWERLWSIRKWSAEKACITATGRQTSLLFLYEEEKPVAYQVFGSEPEIMAFTARALEERENAILDINMGCPVPKIVKNGEGSALFEAIGSSL